MQKKIAREVMGVCESCQACQRPRSFKSTIKSTPVPPALMCSVCLELFSLPPVEQNGQILDTLIVCVDRHSGWIVAIPERKVGLMVAKMGWGFGWDALHDLVDRAVDESEVEAIRRHVHIQVLARLLQGTV